MQLKNSIWRFLFEPSESFREGSYYQIIKESSKHLVRPLRVIAFMVAISGLFAMIFEVRYHSELRTEVYFVRLISTFIAFLILVFVNSRNAEKYSNILVHILLLTIIVSTGIMIYLIPSTLIVNAQIVALLIFTSAMFLTWEVKNQIIVAIYYNLVFASAILLNDDKIYFLPNMFESLIFVLFLSLLSVLGSAINFRLRLQIASESFKTEESEKKYRSIFNNSLLGIFQTSIDGKIIIANDSLAKVLGYNSGEDLVSKNVLDFYIDVSEREKLIKALEVNGTVEDFRVELKTKNGEAIYAKLNARLVKDLLPHQFIEGAVQEITEQIIAEKIRDEYQQSLKEEKEKSEQLAQEALNLSKTKSKFLANMSHEIRTPMNGIIGFLSLLETSSYKDEVEMKQYVSNAKHSAESLLDIVNTILDLSKIEAGKIEIENLNFNLNKVIEQAISIVEPKAKEKSLKITTILPPSENCNFIGDPTKIRQIYLNLLGNSVKFTEEGEIKIEVKIELESENRVKVLSSISDTGSGIPADKINELFKPFSQVDGSESKKFGGTGLGLVICKEFVNLMNGDVKVSSEEGKGSKFEFYISLELQTPLQIKETPDRELKTAKISKEKSTRSVVIDESDKSLRERRGKFNILIAEDNLINQRVLMRSLMSAGYNVDAVVNGNQVLMEHAEKGYDLIVLDLKLPVLDGYKTVEKIRQMDNKNDVPVLALSIHSLIDDKEKCLEAGINDVIQKTSASKEIVEVMDRHLIFFELKEEKKIISKNDNPNGFDFDRLKQVSLGDKQFEKELLSDFLKDAESKFDEFRRLVDEKNIRKIQDVAHTLKGSSYSVGAKQIGDEALGIELSAKSDDLGSIEERLPKLSKAIRETNEILKNIVQ